MTEPIITEYCQGRNKITINYETQGLINLVALDIDSYNKALAEKTPVGWIEKAEYTGKVHYSGTRFNRGAKVTWQFFDYKPEDDKYKITVSGLSLETGNTFTQDYTLGESFKEGVTIEIREFLSGGFFDVWDTYYVLVAPDGSSQRTFHHSNGRLTTPDKQPTSTTNVTIVSNELAFKQVQLKYYSDGVETVGISFPIFSIGGTRTIENSIRVVMYSESLEPLDGDLLKISQFSETISMFGYLTDNFEIKQYNSNSFSYIGYSPSNYRIIKYFQIEGSNPPPFFEVICEGCPPNTCSVLCGDTVCCYGSDGIAIESYPLQ